MDPPLPPARNMAIDEAIAIAFAKNKTHLAEATCPARVVPPTLRLYQWESPALTLGSFQKIDPTLRQFLEANPITPIRRITGGQALLHDRDLTYSIIASTHDPLFLGGIKKTFYSIAQGLLAGLQTLGISAKIHIPMRDNPSRRSPFCVVSLSWYEIAVSGGEKLIGSAQKRWIDHFLQHGSLPLEPSPLEKSLYEKKSITLSDLLNRLPSLSAIEEALKVGFETAWSIRLEKGDLTSKENQLVDYLLAERYTNAAWTEERVPQNQSRILGLF
ncbi:MAG: hypothetical protein HY037_00495 [Nitrospirae bacterium]|nr:hypothetical protein [Candidatus Troglogloeales bacterium]